ncbi:MAG: type I restriction endonuclease subunit R, partial [Chryseobacterium sp.]
YNVKFLTDYFQRSNIIPKFYFIVDRIDLANQASVEFGNRGLTVNRVNSRSEFLTDIKKVSAVHNSAGDQEIAVVNIQKFTEETVANKDLDYDINLQRVYFIDEAHRGYNPKGTALVNLLKSDDQAIKIALTGTPLLREVAKEYDSKALFGDYIHKYYYNMSIADGYTLRLIREGIDTSYSMQLKEILEQFELQEGILDKSEVFAHPKFVRPMLDYILGDLTQFREQKVDNSLGAMVVCDSSKQAKALFDYFQELHGEQELNHATASLTSEITEPGKNTKLKAALILHDVNSKDDRKEQVRLFKSGHIDILFVYNMLLTGFDAKRLKKLYLARVVKDHNLLQTLTRVNRPYKTHPYGYVVDFADITSAFKETNDNYFKELQGELGNEMQHYSQLFKSKEEIDAEILEIKEKLFQFDAVNAEIFSQQVSEIKDKKELLDLIKVLKNARELKNIIRLQGLEEELSRLDFHKLNQLLNAAQGQLDKLNVIDNLNNTSDHT